MSFSMAGGSYSYNRFNNFDKLVEGAKPDFLDMDKDGNKKESFKKAVKDKEKGGEQKECTCKEWVESLLDEGYDLSEYTWDDMERMFEQSHIQYPKGPKMSFTKSKKDPKVAAGREAAKKMGLKMNEYRDPVSYALESDKKMMKLHGGDKKMTSKKKVTKEDVMQHLMDEGFVSNEVSAEVLFNHMSDDWLVSLETAIEEAYKAYPQGKVETKMMKKFDSGDRKKEKQGIKMGDVNSDMKNPTGMAVNVKRSSMGRDAAMMGKRGY